MKLLRLSLSRDYLIFAATIFITITALSVTFWRITNSASQETSRHKIELTGNIVNNIFSGALDRTYRKIYILGKKIADSGNNAEQINQILRNSFNIDIISNPNSSIDIFNVNWVDTQNKITVSSKDGILTYPKSPAAYYQMNAAQNTPWQMHISSPLTNDSHDSIPISMGITNKSGVYIGSLIVKVSLYSIIDEIYDALKQLNTATIILDDNNNLIIPPNFKKYTNKIQPQKYDVSKNVLALKQSFQDNNFTYSHYLQNHRYPYVAIIGINQKLERQSLYSLLITQIITLVAIGMVIIIVLFFFYRRIIKPIKKLANIAQQLSAEKTDYHNIKIPGKNPSVEIFNLAKALHSIKRYQMRLQKSNSELGLTKEKLEKYIEIAEHSELLKQKIVKQFRYLTNESLKGIKDGINILSNTLKGNSSINMNKETKIKLLDIIHEELTYISDFTSGTLNKEHIDTNEIISDCLEIQKKLILKKELNFTTKINPKLPRIYVDKGKFIQIINGLLSRINSTVNPKEQITFTAKESTLNKQKYLALTITIKSKVASLLSSTIEDSDDDIDFSLETTKTLLILHQGEIEIKETAGNDTTISVRIPVFPAKEKHKKAPKTPPQNVVKLFQNKK